MVYVFFRGHWKSTVSHLKLKKQQSYFCWVSARQNECDWDICFILRWVLTAPPSQPGRSTNRLAVESNLQQKIAEGHAYSPRTNNVITVLTGLEHENPASGNIHTLSCTHHTVQRYLKRFIWERSIIAHHLLSAVSTAVASRQLDRIKEDLVSGHVLVRASFFFTASGQRNVRNLSVSHPNPPCLTKTENPGIISESKENSYFCETTNKNCSKDKNKTAQ